MNQQTVQEIEKQRWIGRLVTAVAQKCFALISQNACPISHMQPEFAAEWARKTSKSLADILAHRVGLVRFYLSRLPDSA